MNTESESSTLPGRLRNDDVSIRRTDWYTLWQYHLFERTWDEYPDFDYEFGPPPDFPEKILVIQLSSIGDVTYTIPFLWGLHERYPGKRIDFVSEKRCSMGVVDHPGIDRLHQLPTQTWMDQLQHDSSSVLSDMRNQINEFNNIQYDYLINLHWSPGASILGHLIDREVRNGLFMDDQLDPVLYGNPYFTYHILSGSGDNPATYLRSPSKDRIYCDAISGSQKLYAREDTGISNKMEDLFHDHSTEKNDHVLINTGSRMEDRQWKASHCTRTVHSLREKNFEIGLIGGPDDEERLDQVYDQFVEDSGVIPWYRWTNHLLEDMHLADYVEGMITTDSGPLHLISMRGIPCVDLVSSLWVGPWNSDSIVLQSKQSPEIENIPAVAIVDATTLLTRGETLDYSDYSQVKFLEGRPDERSFWFRYYDCTDQRPNRDTFRNWLAFVASLNLWGEQARKYGWEGLSLSPGDVRHVYQLYWEGDPPELETQLKMSDLTADHLVDVSVRNEFKSNFEQWQSDIYQ